MKILYLHQYFNTPEMSGGTRSYEMARRLVKAGHEVHVITSWCEDGDKQGWFETEVDGINVHWIPVHYSNHLSFTKRMISFFKFAILSARKAAALKSDLVFATSTPLTIAFPAVFASKFQKIPMVFEVRDLWPELPIAMGALKNPITRFAAKWLEKWAYRNSEAVVALSPGMCDGVVTAGYARNCVAVIPNSSDNDLFTVPSTCGEKFREQREWLRDKPLLVYTGTFGLINGVGYLVELAKELLSIAPDVRILLVGDGKEYTIVKEKAQTLGVLNVNLFIESKIPKSEIPALMNAADMACSLFIDKKEMQHNSANKFFDTLASGKPILINYGGWMKDLIELNGCGLVTWKLSANEAALLISGRITDRSWLSSSGKEAKKLANSQFDRDMLAEQLEKVLLEVAGGRNSNAASITSKYYD